jgi:hypothetical protein
MRLTELTADPVVPTQASEDALAVLRGAMPDRLWRFADLYAVRLDAPAAAAAVVELDPFHAHAQLIGPFGERQPPGRT